MKKLTYEYVKEFINSTGYTLLSDNYKNNMTKLLIRCDKGHEYSVTIGNFQKGNRCSICSGVNNKKLTYSYVKEFINSTGYTLLSNDYTNIGTKLLIRCDKGHEYSAIFKSFKNGCRCSICSHKKAGFKKRISFSEVKETIEMENYTLLSNDYINSGAKLKVICPEGHEYNVSFSHFKNGTRCRYCMSDILNIKLKHSYDYVKSYIESFGYTLLSDTYTNNKSKIEIKCDKGHRFSMIFNSFQRGQRCPICWNNSMSSKQENDVVSFINSFNLSTICNDRTQIINPYTGRYLELDIWIPSIKKAVEYNGTYWHSFTDVKITDKIKQEQCKQLGIDLLIVKEHNWINNNEFEREIIRRFING